MDRKPLPELLELYKGNEEVKRQAGKTTRQHLGALSAIWGRAESRGLIVEDKANPFLRHKIKVIRKGGGNRLSLEEVNAVLSLPVFTKGERPRGCRGEAGYWIPLLSLFTGARPGEVAQLIVSDFDQDGSGKWFIRYTDEGEHPEIGQRRLKTTEKGTGQRRFPVPQGLIDLGIIDYLDWLKARHEVAFFPELTLRSKGLYDGWSRWWGRYVREHGAIPEGKRPLREFRHTFTTACRASGISEAAISYIDGHSTLSGITTGTYGEHDSRGLEIEKLRFDGLDFGVVRRWSAP